MSTDFIVSNGPSPNRPLPNFGPTVSVVIQDENASTSALSEKDMRAYLNQRRQFEKMEQFAQEARAMFFAPSPSR